MRGNLAVEEGLGEGGLVGLVVAVAAVAHHVDHDVALELLAEFERQLGHIADGLGVVAIHVEDRRLDHFGDVGAVAAGARLNRAGGEADLVVDDEVQRTPGGVAGELRIVEHLGDDALGRERGIAMEEKRKDAAARGVAAETLPGADLALHDRVDGLEVRGIGSEAHLNLFPGGGVEHGLVTEVIFHVAVALHRVGDEALGELLEDELEGFAEEVGEDVEPAAVGHAQHDLVDAGVRAAFDNGVERGDERLAALEGEAFLADVLGVQEMLKELGLVEAVQDADLLLAGEIGLVAARLHAGLQPAPDLGFLDVEILDADVPAVGLLEAGDQIDQPHLAAVEVVADVEKGLEIGFAESKFAQREARRGRGRIAERIEVRPDVADGAIVIDEAVDLRLLEAVDEGGGHRRGAGEHGHLAVESERETLKERAPRRIDGVGILEPPQIVLLDQIGVGAGGQGGGNHGRRKPAGFSGVPAGVRRVG